MLALFEERAPPEQEVSSMSESRSILEEASSLRSLGDVLSWAYARRPPAEFLEVVAMDEFTNDVIVRVTPEIYLVFDST
jgi:hypothetical protein